MDIPNVRVPVNVSQKEAMKIVEMMILNGFEKTIENEWTEAILYGFRKDGKMTSTEVLVDIPNRKFQVYFRP